jgi:hypothetical protein
MGARADAMHGGMGTLRTPVILRSERNDNAA